MKAYLYIPCFSYHSKHVFKSFIHSELRRYAMCCTDSAHLVHIRSLFKERLLNRGYPLLFIESCMEKVYVRDEILFPPYVKLAYMKQTCLPIPRSSHMYSFNAPNLAPPSTSAGGDGSSMLIAYVDNTPRFSDSAIRDIFSYEKQGQAFMHDTIFPLITENRRCPMLSRPPAPKIRNFLLRSKYVSPNNSTVSDDVVYDWEYPNYS